MIVMSSQCFVKWSFFLGKPSKKLSASYPRKRNRIAFSNHANHYHGTDDYGCFSPVCSIFHKLLSIHRLKLFLKKPCKKTKKNVHLFAQLAISKEDTAPDFNPRLNSYHGEARQGVPGALFFLLPLGGG